MIYHNTHQLLLPDTSVKLKCQFSPSSAVPANPAGRGRPAIRAGRVRPHSGRARPEPRGGRTSAPPPMARRRPRASWVQQPLTRTDRGAPRPCCARGRSMRDDAARWLCSRIPGMCVCSMSPPAPAVHSHVPATSARRVCTWRRRTRASAPLPRHAPVAYLHKWPGREAARAPVGEMG